MLFSRPSDWHRQHMQHRQHRRVKMGPARRCYAAEDDLMGIKDLSPWSFGPTGHHPGGLNLKNFTPEEQCLLYEIGMASNRH